MLGTASTKQRRRRHRKGMDVATPTIRDVAAAAGVSVAHVSRVMNERGDVGPLTRARVLAAVAQLGYRPNGAARSLRTRAAAVLGLIISDITNPFFTSMARGVEDAAQNAGFSVVLANADEELAKERQYLEIALAEQMAGVVLSPASSTQTNVAALTDRGVPVVVIDRRLRNTDLDSVTVNNTRAARDATAHLVAQGCRRIGFVSGLTETSSAAGRLAGYRAALRAAGPPFDQSLVADGGFRIEGGYRATAELLERGIDGLFVANNLMTIGALQVLHERAIDIPGEVALVGFDDMPWTGAMRPPLSMVAQPTYEIGSRATSLLLARIRGDESSAKNVVLPASLVLRESSLRADAARP